MSVRTNGGRVVFASGGRAIPATKVDDARDPPFGDLHVSVGILAAAAEQLIVGGIPPSGMPVVVVLLLTGIALGGHSAAVATRTVDMHIANLRSKLEDDPAKPRHILTVLKAGIGEAVTSQRNAGLAPPGAGRPRAAAMCRVDGTGNRQQQIGLTRPRPISTMRAL